MTKPTTYPFKSDDIPEPYTEQTEPANVRDSEKYCPNCQYRVICRLPDARCGKCSGRLITIWKSALGELVK